MVVLHRSARSTRNHDTSLPCVRKTTRIFTYLFLCARFTNHSTLHRRYRLFLFSRIRGLRLGKTWEA